MRRDELLSLLEGVQDRGVNKSVSRCPAHPDRNPSLSICDGKKGVLVKCWSGCSLQNICKSLGITPRDLFYDALEIDPRQRKLAAQQREAQRKQREYEAFKLGRLLDACREADYFLQSRRAVDIGSWGDDRLNRELNLIADAYWVLEADPYAY